MCTSGSTLRRCRALSLGSVVLVPVTGDCDADAGFAIDGAEPREISINASDVSVRLALSIAESDELTTPSRLMSSTFVTSAPFV